MRSLDGVITTNAHALCQATIRQGVRARDAWTGAPS